MQYKIYLDVHQQLMMKYFAYAAQPISAKTIPRRQPDQIKKVDLSKLFPAVITVIDQATKIGYNANHFVHIIDCTCC